MGTRVEINLDKPTGNFWIDNGLVVLADLMGEGIFELDEIRNCLHTKLIQKTGNKGEYWDQETGQVKEYEKSNWKYPANLFIKVAGKPQKIKCSDGNTYFKGAPTFELKMSFGKRGHCDICGDQNYLEDAKQWMFPFVVDPGKFANFYSDLKRGMKLCPRCAVSGLAGYHGLLWSSQATNAMHIFIFHTDLREMLRLRQEVFDPLSLTQQKGGNVPVAFFGPYVHEITLGLLLELFSYIRKSDGLPQEARDYLANLLGASETSLALPLSMYTITGIRGQSFDMHSLEEFSRLRDFYMLYKSWITTLGRDNPENGLKEIFRQFYKREGNRDNTLWRDKIAWAVLEFGDPLPFAEQFLYEVRAKQEKPGPLAWGTEDILEKYTKEVLEMEQQLLDVLKDFGHSLGRKAQENREMGLLYSLRNAKNPEEFYRVLNDMQFRLGMTIPEDLLIMEKAERIMNNPWVRVKTLLSIYAMNAYLRSEQKPRKEATNEPA